MDDDIVNALALMPSVLGEIEIEDIDLSGADMRRTKVSAVRDAALTASIQRRGVLQSVGVRPLDPPIDGKTYQVAFGRRRIRCAAAAGLTRVPARIANWTDHDIAAVNRAENMQRSEPHPIERWCAVSDLVDAGFTLEQAAAELGLDDRETEQMERLGRLHPSLLALAEIEMPTFGQLRIIANAPLDAQEAAGKAPGVLSEENRGPGSVKWHSIVQRCRVERIAKRHAIFDVAAHADMFTPDLFAQPDDPDAIATDQVARFMELQHAALEARAERQRASGRRVKVVDLDAKSWMAAVPKGFTIVSNMDGRKPGKTETVFTAIRADGSISEVLAGDVAAQRAAEKKAAERRAGKGKASAGGEATAAAEATGGDDDDVAGEHQVDDDPPADPDAPRISKAAQDIIADAKTQALGAALTEFAKTGEAGRMLGLMILALTAKNVSISPYDAAPEDAVAELIGPGGVPLLWSEGTVVQMAAETLGNMLTIGGPSTKYGRASGPAAEWIGAAIGAGEYLRRFDTPEFLAQVPMAGLKDLAREAGLRTSGTAKDLRMALVSKLPAWRPSAAAFGAPAPKPRARDY